MNGYWRDPNLRPIELIGRNGHIHVKKAKLAES